MNKNLIEANWIQARIYQIRGCKVMLSNDLAELYQAEPKVLIQAVKKNAERFPSDFMFQLQNQEFINLKSQIVTSSWGGLRKLPYAFTELGIAMLSGVLHSPRAIQVNLEIMRTFVALRRYVETYKELSDRLDYLEEKHDSDFKIIFDAIRELMTPPSETPKRKIGIKPGQ